MERVKLRPGIASIWIPADGSALCQVCGRLIGCSRGLIAHHGYSRPGGKWSGWQTASCMGARHRPYETHRDQVGNCIQVIKAHILMIESRLHKLSERAPDLSCDFTYTKYGANRVQNKNITVYCTAETFDARREEHIVGFRQHCIDSFDTLVATHVGKQKYALNSSKIDLETMQARWDHWKPILA